ncbi:ABC transporter permease [uncultured Alsobacter sp.]|uniref:ABC transporter permease n=1 Tax=uncultured Alsobacter sp. TaxID=1748258 RepID=UPI0025E5363A|nr:ABC transporter permease [uncultured Alsobacter sp.]
MPLAFLARRLGMTLLVIVLAIGINFLIPRAMPGDPIEQQLNQLAASSGGNVGDVQAMVASYRARFGLDQPLWRQFLSYLGDLAHFDLGFSLANYPERVSQSIAAGLPWTLGLLGVSTLISFTIGTLLGGLLAWPGSGRLVRLVGVPLLMLSAVPYFVLGIVLLFLLALAWPLLPVGGGYPFSANLRWDWESARMIAVHAILPSLSIILASLGTWAIAMRGMIVSVLGEDYIMLAEAKGLSPARIFFGYGLRNAMLPQLTHLALTLSHIVSGAILVEVIFAYPGIGYRLYQAIQAKDYFVIQGIVLLLSISIAVTMLVMDLIYPLIDPRIGARRT